MPDAKPTTKAERRALQEKQRAAKAALRSETETAPKKKAPPPRPVEKKAPEGLVAHLTPYTKQAPMALSSELHPAIVSLGLRYKSGAIDGANVRCVAMLAALKAAVRDYTCPRDAAIARDLDKKLKVMFQFLIDCRPHSVSMGAAIKHVRAVVSKLAPETTEREAKIAVCGAMDDFVQERVVLPGTVIGDKGADAVHDGDVLLTFAGGGDSVRRVFAAAKAQGKRFKVVVLDAAPGLKGRALLPYLHSLGVDAAYFVLNALASALSNVDTVFVGAEALYSNGAALADAGTAAVAMAAARRRVPVLVCCETYKFHAKVQLDSLSWNELGDPDALRPQQSTAEGPPPQRINLRFDVTPDKYITAIITEHGLVPPSACAVLVRELDAAMAAPPTGAVR